MPPSLVLGIDAALYIPPAALPVATAPLRSRGDGGTGGTRAMHASSLRSTFGMELGPYGSTRRTRWTPNTEH